MPLMPKRVKYRKTQRGSRKGLASRNIHLDVGEFGLQTLERAWITNTQIEAARVALTRNMKRKGKLWIRIFPDKSVTARPPETRIHLQRPPSDDEFGRTAGFPRSDRPDVRGPLRPSLAGWQDQPRGRADQSPPRDAEGASRSTSDATPARFPWRTARHGRRPRSSGRTPHPARWSRGTRVYPFQS